MKTVICLVMLGGIVSGCSTTVHLSSPLDANRKIDGGSARLTLSSGSMYFGSDIRIAQDSTWFVNQADDSLVRLRTQDVRLVQLTHRGGGAIEGLMLGGLGGLGVGLGVGLLASVGWGAGEDAGMGRALLAFATTILGGAGGLIVGAIKGHDYTFIMPVDSARIGSQMLGYPGSDR